MYLLNQIDWDNFIVRKTFIPYRRVTLEFLISLYYDPNRGFGFGRGLATFRLFGTNFRFTHHEMASLLGFPNGPDAFTITPDDAFTNLDLDYFWGTITRNYHHEPHTMFSENIHNPVIRYFHKILAHTLFSKEENIISVSRDDVFIMYYASQGRPVNAATFMLVNLDRITQDIQGTILIRGLVIMIVDAIVLRYPFNRIHSFGVIRPMHLNFLFNRSIISNLGPTKFELLINNQVVLKFTLPNHEKTNVHNRDNWLYNLEGQSESPTPPGSP